MQTRRTFLRQTLAVAGAAMALSTGSFWGAEHPELLLNHVGFAPHRAKFILIPASAAASEFTVVDASTMQVVHKGKLTRCDRDFGSYLLGDASDLVTSGTFSVCAGGQSAALVIDPDIYTGAIHKCVSYFAIQRCGDSHTGYHSPCHLDDGKRSDTGEHLDVTGGWHDACDLRRWVDATIYGMIGLTRVLDVMPEQLDIDRTLEELHWGNLYFRKMQDRSGFVMNYCGGDDGNRFTDNQIGTGDERIIHVEPAETPAQFHFIAAQAAMARLTREKDPGYAIACEESARKCLDWVMSKRSPGAAISLSAGILAALEMNRTAPDPKFRNLSAGFAKKLLALQVRKAKGSDPLGFFLTAPDKPQPLREIQHGNLPLIALCEAAQAFADHPDAPDWRAAIELHCQFLVSMSARSAFGTIPFGLYFDRDPGGDRRVGSNWYRWFMRPRDEYYTGDWWVGINAFLASNGIGLLKASRVLHEPKLAQLAQRQLDWIVGVNPFNSSTVTEIGRNQPPLYRPGAFKPPTPLIPGGVMNGIGGSEMDEPILLPGSYHTCEYWTPMVAYTLWLMAELQRK